MDHISKFGAKAEIVDKNLGYGLFGKEQIYILKGDVKMKDTLDGLEEVLEKDNRRVKEYDTEIGGVYLETTEDPRGWMLGDKTRRVYETTIPQITSFLLKNHQNLLQAFSAHCKYLPSFLF